MNLEQFLKTQLKSKSKTIFLLLSASIIAGCSLMNVDSKRSEMPMIKEVPYQARDSEELRKKLIVLPFLNNELQKSQNLSEIARRTVIDEIMSTRNFLVINNDDVGKDLGSFINENKEYDLVAVSRLGANLGISAVIEGRVVEVRARRIGDEIGVFRKLRAQADVTVQIRVFGAKIAKEIYKTTRKVTVESEATRIGESSYSDSELQADPNLLRMGVRKAFKETVGGIVRAVEKLSWEGRIALVNSEKIYVNAGRLSGIQVGDILKITEEGDEVFDPDTGSFIGEAPGRMKGTVEVVSYFGKDGAIGIVHSGSGFKENDRVELY